MIAKRVSMNSIQKSSFGGLTSYITNAQEKNERVGKVSITNCESQTVEWAIAEITATQNQNTRAKTDKTYHLILSFRAGEQPSEDVLTHIEQRICEGLGYDEHQRISAVHHDTDNLHIHIAINKIHPERLTILEPYYDKKTLGKLCAELEQRFGLEVDNHTASKGPARTNAADMESAAGLESLIGWVKRDCMPDLKAANSWEMMHQAMAKNGLRLHKRANGLVITDHAGITVKASSIDRSLSQQGLESRLGAFQPAASDTVKAAPTRSYVKKPMASSMDTSALYQRYQESHAQRRTAKAVAWEAAKTRKDRLIADAKRNAKIKRTLLRTTGGISRKILLALVSKTLQDEIAKINRQYHATREVVFTDNQRPAWADWLQEQARAGDSEALAALRARKPRQPLTGNIVGGITPQQTDELAEQHPDGVTRKGTAIYRAGDKSIRDDGTHFKIPDDASQAALTKALRLATQRHGPMLSVSGSELFKDRLARAAAASNLNVGFASPHLERRRQLLKKTVAVRHSKQTLRAAGGRLMGLLARQVAPPLARKAFRYLQDIFTHQTHSRPLLVKGRGRALPPPPPTQTQERNNVRSIDAGLSGNQFPGRTATRNAFPGERYRGTTNGKPNIGRVGSVPPPESRNCLRDMPERSLVRGPGETSMLLPRDVPSYVEQQEAISVDGMRRGVRGPGGGIAPDAVMQYISERNAKRSTITDIPKHTRYNDQVHGEYNYAGLRVVDGCNLALLKSGEEIFVLEIDSKAAAAFKRLKVGAHVAMAENGKLKRKGRSQ